MKTDDLMNQPAILNYDTRTTERPLESPVLLVFSDDWGRHPSSCQHLIAHLLDDFQVIWVNTIGMRPPRLNWSTVTRGWEKLRGWSRPKTPASSLPRNLQVTQPLMWPWVKRRHDRQINRFLLSRRLKHELEAIDAPIVAITTIPIVADIMETLPVERWVYYCVDDFGCWPGLERQSLRAMERIVLQNANVVIAAATHLQQRHSKLRDDVHLLQHGINLTHWQTKQDARSAIPLTSQQQPRVTFWGLIDRRMDVSFVQELSARLETGSINLIGPQDNPHPRLGALKNVRFHPAVSYEELPQYAAVSDVLVMPYEDAPVTRAMQPLKLLEYLATGLPVVVRDLPANREWADCLDLANGPAEFADLVLKRLKTGTPPEQLSARGRLADESWQKKAEEFRALILNQI